MHLDEVITSEIILQTDSRSTIIIKWNQDDSNSFTIGHLNKLNRVSQHLKNGKDNKNVGYVVSEMHRVKFDKVIQLPSDHGVIRIRHRYGNTYITTVFKPQCGMVQIH